MIYANDRLREASKRVIAEFGVVEPPVDEAELRRCDVLLGWPSRMHVELILRMSGLRAIQTLSAGVDMLPFSAIPPKVLVFSNAGAFTLPVSEQIWGLILGMAKGLNLRNQKVVPRILRGKTLVVLGAGSIGSEVARIAKAAFDMETVGVSRSFKSPEIYDEKHPLSALASVVGRADVIVDVLPLTSETRSALDYGILRRTRENVIIVNAGRGETVDEGGIHRILKERPETRFATDVFWTKAGRESFDSPLWDLPNFGGSLHIAGGIGNDEPLAEAELMAVENVRRFLTTGSALNLVDQTDYRRLRPDSEPITYK